MVVKHTPAPWKAYDEYPEVIEFSTPDNGDYGGLRITVHGANYKTGGWIRKEEQAANMRLIAAAPELLAAVRELAIWTALLAETAGVEIETTRMQFIGDKDGLILSATVAESLEKARLATQKAEGSLS